MAITITEVEALGLGSKFVFDDREYTLTDYLFSNGRLTLYPRWAPEVSIDDNMAGFDAEYCFWVSLLDAVAWQKEGF